MDGLVGILALAVLVGTWWWLAGRMKQNGRGWLLRNFAGSSAGCFMGLLVVVLALQVGIIKEKPQADGKPDAPASAEKPAEVQPAPPVATEPLEAPVKKSLGVTPEVYASRLNPILKKFEKSYRLDPKAVKDGEVHNTLSANLGPYASLVATISKENGEILELTLIGAGNGSPASGLEIMSVASAALASAAPGADFRDVFKQLPTMMEGKPEIYGNVKLSVKTTQEIGTWFFAAPI